MSVDVSRHAAAQRTAAQTPRARGWKLAASWLLIIPTLSLFSFSVVAGAGTPGGKPDYAGAVKDLPRGNGDVVVVVGAGKHDDAGEDPGSNGLLHSFTRGSSKQVVCTITARQYAAVSHVYRTTRIQLSIGHVPLDIVVVRDAKEQDLRTYLGAPGITCRMVEIARTFFLPFDAHTS